MDMHHRRSEDGVGGGRRRTSVKFLALLVYGVDCEDVIKEDIGRIRSHFDARVYDL